MKINYLMNIKSKIKAKANPMMNKVNLKEKIEFYKTSLKFLLQIKNEVNILKKSDKIISES